MRYVPVTLMIPVPEELHQETQRFLDAHPSWSQERFFAAAIALFLMQNGTKSRVVSRLYLDCLFDCLSGFDLYENGGRAA